MSICTVPRERVRDKLILPTEVEVSGRGAGCCEEQHRKTNSFPSAIFHTLLRLLPNE